MHMSDSDHAFLGFAKGEILKLSCGKRTPSLCHYLRLFVLLYIALNSLPLARRKRRKLRKARHVAQVMLSACWPLPGHETETPRAGPGQLVAL